MMHKAWSSIEEVPYCFSRSSVKFQGHIALKIVEFDSNWAFPDCNSSLNSPMAMKCCTKLKTAKKRCRIVFQGHPSNFKVTRDKTSPILTQIGRFRTIGRSQLSNPSGLPCFVVWRLHSVLMYEILSLCIPFRYCNSPHQDLMKQTNIQELLQHVCRLTHWGRVTHICISDLTIIFQIMACRLVGAKPLSEPMLNYC